MLKSEAIIKLKIFGKILFFLFIFFCSMGIYNTVYGKIIDQMLVFISLLCATKISMRFFEKKKMIDIGLRFSKRNTRELLLGVVLPVVMLSIVFLFYIVFGFGYVVTGDIYFIDSFLLPFFLYILVAFNEEILFRGYMFQKFIELTNKYVALFLLSICFGFAHVFNPHISALSVINIILVGMFFSICYIKTTSLWLPISMHFTWNFVQGVVFGFPVSGEKYSDTISFVSTGPEWITGGHFGPEGSILVSVLLLAVSLLIIYNKKLVAVTK